MISDDKKQRGSLRIGPRGGHQHIIILFQKDIVVDEKNWFWYCAPWCYTNIYELCFKGDVLSWQSLESNCPGWEDVVPLLSLSQSRPPVRWDGEREGLQSGLQPPTITSQTEGLGTCCMQGWVVSSDCFVVLFQLGWPQGRKRGEGSSLILANVNIVNPHSPHTPAHNIITSTSVSTSRDSIFFPMRKHRQDVRLSWNMSPSRESHFIMMFILEDSACLHWMVTIIKAGKIVRCEVVRYGKLYFWIVLRHWKMSYDMILL